MPPRRNLPTQQTSLTSFRVSIPGGCEAERNTQHNGRQGAFPLRQNGHRHHADPGDQGRARQPSKGDPDRTQRRCAPSDQPQSRQPDWVRERYGQNVRPQTRSPDHSSARRKFAKSTASTVLADAYRLPSASCSAWAVFCALQFLIPDLSYSRGFFRGGSKKSIGRAHRTETEIATSTLPRTAFEYGQMA